MTDDNEEYWPDYITAIKSVRYDIESIRDSIRDYNNEDPTFDDVLQMIYEYAKDDFSCGWGHEARIKDLVFIDSDGEEY